MNKQSNVTAEPIEAVMSGTELGPVEEIGVPVEETPEKPPSTHVRAGFTTHKGQGEGKARRKMAAKSRRINRGK